MGGFGRAGNGQEVVDRVIGVTGVDDHMVAALSRVGDDTGLLIGGEVAGIDQSQMVGHGDCLMTFVRAVR